MRLVRPFSYRRNWHLLAALGVNHPGGLLIVSAEPRHLRTSRLPMSLGAGSFLPVPEVDMKSPPSITLSPGVMLASKSMVASAGVSEKYPMGKSEAMQRAIEGAEGYNAFPAQRLRQNARWLLDE
ncbi:unnamed protein product, partial [Effrenium voratum]